MVPQGRIELPTSPLPRVRSTTELLRRDAIGDADRGAVIRLNSRLVQALTGRFFVAHVWKDHGTEKNTSKGKAKGPEPR